MSYLYSAFRFLIVYKEQIIYSVFSVNLDIGPHTASVTSKITENSLVTDICPYQIFGIFAGDRRPCGPVVEHPLQEVVGSNPGRAIPKALKMVPVATLLGAQHYKASTGFSSPNKYRTTNIATLTNIKKSEKSLIIINVCIHRRTVWKTGNYAKYVILLKYRDYYYYYVCQQQIYRLFAIDRRLSAAHFPNICY